MCPYRLPAVCFERAARDSAADAEGSRDDLAAAYGANS